VEGFDWVTVTTVSSLPELPAEDICRDNERPAHSFHRRQGRPVITTSDFAMSNGDGGAALANVASRLPPIVETPRCVPNDDDDAAAGDILRRTCRFTK